MECYSKRRLIRNREWVRAWVIDNLVNAIGSGGKIPIWTLEITKCSNLGEFLKGHAMWEIKKGKGESISLRVST